MKNRKKVLHVCKNFALEKGGGGVARHIAGLICSFPSGVFDFRIAAPMVGDNLHPDNYDVAKLTVCRLRSHLEWADIIHVHGARTIVAASAAIIGHFMGKRVIYTPHCYYDEKGAKGIAKLIWDHTVERFLLCHCHAVILLSTYWLNYLHERKLHVENPIIVPNCVLDAWVRPLSNKMGKKLKGKPAILSISRLDPVKKIDTAIRALLSPDMEMACLHIVGTGPYRQRLESLAAEFRVSDRVLFHGFVPDAEMAALVSGADVFVLPSAQEGMPTTLIEMILMGLPVVASDNPGNRSILEKVGYDTLYVVDDFDKLSEKIMFAADYPLPEHVIAATRNFFTWEQQQHCIQAAYGFD